MLLGFGFRHLIKIALPSKLSTQGLQPAHEWPRQITEAILHFLTVELTDPYDQGRIRRKRSQKLGGLAGVLSKACRSAWSFFWFSLISDSVNRWLQSTRPFRIQ